MEKPVSAAKITKEDFLLAANELADKYQLSNLAVRKLAAWCNSESGLTIFNNNPGNIRPKTGEDYYYHPGNVDEYINGKHVVATVAKDPLRKFKSFNSLSDGIEGMLLWLINKHTVALAALRDDEKNGYDFGMALGLPNNKGMHYYTANPKRYSTTVENCFKDMLKF